MKIGPGSSVEKQEYSKVERDQNLESQNNLEKGIDQTQSAANRTFDEAHWAFFWENLDPDLKRDLEDVGRLSDLSVAELDRYIEQNSNQYTQWKADSAQDVKHKILDNQSGKV